MNSYKEGIVRVESNGGQDTDSNQLDRCANCQYQVACADIIDRMETIVAELGRQLTGAELYGLEFARESSANLKANCTQGPDFANQCRSAEAPKW